MNYVSRLFYIKKDKIDKRGEAPIYLRLSIGQKKIEIYLRLKVHPKYWDSTKQRCKSPKNASINHRIEIINSKVTEIESRFIARKETPNLGSIKLELSGESQSSSVLDFWEEYLSRVQKLIDIDFAESTYKKYRTARKHFKDFLSQKNYSDDILFDELKYAVISDYVDYLKFDKKLSHNTSIKYLKNFKAVVNEAKRRGLLSGDPFEGIKLRYEELEIIYLSEAELTSIEERAFEIERLEKVRNYFLFACYTGLSFSDIFSLRAKNIYEVNGVLSIVKNRIKTNSESFIPLSKKALLILEKFDCYNKRGEELIFTKISNQKYNAYLKEIADLCGVDVKLSSHDARRTFATTVTLGKGISIEAVGAMLGHKDLRSTKKYAKVTYEKVLAESRKVGNI